MKWLKAYLKAIRALFPIWLYVIAFLPLIVTLFYTPELVDYRQIIILIAWVGLFTSTYLLTGKKVFYNLGVILFTIISFIELAHLFFLKSPINIISLMAIGNTHFSEATEFLDTKGYSRLFLLIPYLVIVYLSFKNEPKRISEPKIVYTIFLVFSVIFIGENLIHKRLIRKGSPHLVKTVASFIQTVKTLNQIDNTHLARTVDVQEEKSQLNKTIVLILSESTSRNHMQLYGYDKQNNPLLSKRDDLAVYTDVIAGYSNTITSVTRSLSNLNINQADTIIPDLDILDLMNSAGYKTYWISNQPPIGIWETWITLMAKKAQKTVFVNRHSSSSREATQIRSYDEKLFEPFEEALQDSAEDKFIVLHLMGNHTAYNRRYPAEYDKWSGYGEYEQTRAEYANSILYNDFVVNKLIDILDKEKGVSSAIYTSDHGENVYDELDNCGHDYGAVLPRSNVEIPFVMWASEKYKDEFPTKSALIYNRTEVPYKTDDLFNTIADLSGIEAQFVDSTRSVIHPAYDSTRSRMLETGVDYDVYEY